MTNEGEAIVRFAEVSVELAGQLVLEDISFSVRAQEFVGLVGPNGAGKTTLLKAMLGLVPVSRGRIEVFGREPGGAPGTERGIGYLPQRYSIPAGFPATVGDVAMMGRLRGLGPLARPTRADRAAVARSLERVGIAELANRPVGTLSGGQQRRVMLAQALTASSRLLVLDEPTIGLDLPAEHEFYGLLRALQDDFALAVIAVSHDLLALAGECHELICINRRMHIHGNPEHVIHSHAIEEAYSCEFDFLAGEIARHEHAHPRPPGAPSDPDR